MVVQNSKQIDISIIIPVYNAGLLIDRCLDSIFNQKGKYTLEVVLIDDGSSDNSVVLIKARKESNIILLQQENAGPASARNKGLAIASGRYVAYLDADDYWIDGFIHKTISFLDNNADCIAVAVAQRHITLSGDSVSPNYILESDRNKNAFILDNFFDFWANYNHVCTGSITIRADVAKKTNGQREDLRICEDLEFWAYLSTFGNFGFIPEILFVSDGTKVTKEIGWIEKNIKRWNSTPTVDNWETRITTRIANPHPINYVKARGRIARNLCYSILMSKRIDLAYQQIRCYKSSFPDGMMTKILSLGTMNRFFWFVISKVLIFREYNR